MKNLKQKQNCQLRTLLKSLNEPFRKNSAGFTLSFVIGIMIILGCTCGKDNEQNNNKEVVQNNTEKNKNTGLPRKVDGYQIRSFKFSYYLVEKGLNVEQLKVIAQNLHKQEPDTNLILIDDASKLSEYINYAKEYSKGNSNAAYPKEWVKESIIANVQKFTDGKWYLCQKNQMEKFAELE